MRLEDVDLVAAIVVVQVRSPRVEAVEVVVPRLMPVERAPSRRGTELELVAVSREPPCAVAEPRVALPILKERSRERRLERCECRGDDEPPGSRATVIEDLALADPIQERGERRLALLDGVVVEPL